jgi:segregation and condensation protein B
MEITNLIPHIEALIFASDKPLTSLEVTDLVNNAFGFMEDKISLDQVEAAMEGIQEKYASEFYPFELRQSGGGWQFLTKKEFHKTIAQLNGDKFLKRLSAAALETLAIIAYKQPVTKGEIESIRGVSSDYAVQKLLEKELIVISGRNEKLPGHPLVYATSKSFMDYFGINSAEDLPRIKEVLADQLVEPTVIKDAVPEADTSEAETGEAEPAEPQEPTDQHTAAIEEESDSQEAEGDVSDDNNLENETESEDIVFSVSESGELVEKPEDKE